MAGRPSLPEAWLELTDEAADVGVVGRPHRRVSGRRILVLAAVAGLLTAVALPQLVDAVEPALSITTAEGSITTAEGTVARVLTGEAGHQLDGGHVREIEAGPDGALWVAVGRRVLELSTPGSVEPRTRSWQAVPRRLSIGPDGRLWAIEDGGDTIALGDAGWTAATPPEPMEGDPLALDEAALRQLRAEGIEQRPRVLAGAVGPDQERWLLVDVSARPDRAPADRRLLHFGVTGWAVLGPEEGMPHDGRRAWTDPGPEAAGALAVDGRGRAWFSLEHGGLWLADGEGIREVSFPGLGSRALDLAAAPDGAIWIASSRGQLFRWEPEATTAL